MARPTVTVFEPTVTVAGEGCTVRFEVTAEEATRVEFIDAHLTGVQGWSIGSGKSKVAVAVRDPDLVARAMGEGELAAGETRRFTATFPLPPDLPPSHAFTPAYARLQLRVHVSIPWWPDRRHDVTFPVRLPPQRLRRVATIARSTLAAAPAGEPRLDLALPTTEVAAGETLHGAVAVLNVDDDRDREVVIELEAALRLRRGGRTYDRACSGGEIRVHIPPRSAGASVPFAFAVPAHYPPGFSATTHALTWWLRARTGSLLTGRLQVAVPLLIADAASVALSARPAPPPRLGDARAAEAFAAFAAAHGWREVDPAAGEAPALAGQVAIAREEAGLTLRLAHAYRGEDGAFLIATIDHPWLGLGLEVTPGSTLRHVFFADLEIGVPEFDRAYKVAARSAAQATPFLREVVPAVLAARPLGGVARWGDDALVLEAPIGEPLVGDLATAAAALRGVAHVLARALPAIPPPEDLLVDAAAWRALGAALGGEVAIGDLSVSGALGGMPVDVALVRGADGRPAALRVEVGDPAQASEVLRARRLALATPAALALGADLPTAVAERVLRWPGDIVDLRLADGVIGADLALAAPAPGAPPVADAARVRTLARELRAVLAELGAGPGPYR